MNDSPFHSGELQVQESAGVTEAARRVGRAIGDRIPEGGRGFVDRQTMMVIGSVDAEARPWASLLLGAPGFATSPDAATIDVDLERTLRLPQDPLWENLSADPRLGTLFIDLATRRRLRVNGRADRYAEGRLRIAVDEAYGNCPKYIQRRQAVTRDSEPSPTAGPAQRGTDLEDRHRRWIRRADTFFVASAHPEGGADASHRGGNPGFVRLLDERTLWIPDYPGNNMYNTLGNLAVNPAAGLLFPDFTLPALLQLTGRAEIGRRRDEAAGAAGGSEGAWTFRVAAWVEHALPPGLRWELLEASPFNP